MQIKPLVIQLANVARIVTIVVDLQFVAKAAQIVLRQLQSRLGQEQVGEALPHLQSRLPYLIVILRVGLGRSRPRAIQAPAPLLPALKEPRQLQTVTVGSCGGGWIREIGAV